ncbi:MAG: hypothetical protein IKM97_01445 [Clostridia bacterium]|nr:hypothetical protein [Clostridia bacterium]
MTQLDPNGGRILYYELAPSTYYIIGVLSPENMKCVCGVGSEVKLTIQKPITSEDWLDSIIGYLADGHGLDITRDLLLGKGFGEEEKNK